MVKILHLAVHMGGGVGKAISGVCIGSEKKYHTDIVLLEKPNDYFYVNQARDNGISVYVVPDSNQLENLIDMADIVIINWWGHPLMIRFMQNFPQKICRCIIWNHVNGCTYPYLPAEFLLQFSGIMFTTPYSYSNNMWSEYERECIVQSSAVVYGMGHFIPLDIKPKADYSHGERFIIGYVGTIDYAKINRDFLDYYEEIIKTMPDVRVCMLGDVSDEIKAEIEVRNLAAYFELPGHVDDIEEYIYQFDVFAYLLTPDNYATTENALLEAMAYGIPIVVLDNELEKHIIKNNVNGYVVSDVNEFRERIAFLHDVQNAERIGRSAREFVIKEYSAYKNVARYDAICQAALSENKKIYTFADILGNDGYEAFAYFSQTAGSIITEMACNNSSDVFEKVNPIFYSANKGSLYQYGRYYQNDERLRKMVDFFRRKGKGEYR